MTYSTKRIHDICEAISTKLTKEETQKLFTEKIDHHHFKFWFHQHLALCIDNYRSADAIAERIVTIWKEREITA